MRSKEIADATINSLSKNKHALTVVNFAAPDMVGYSRSIGCY